MRLFCDRMGREWAINANGATMAAVQTAANVNLFEIFNDNAALLSKLTTDMRMLGMVLWVFVRQQAVAKSIDAEQFAEGLGGEALDAAMRALVDEVLDFFPNRAAANAARKAMEKLKEAERIATERAFADIEKLSPSDLADSLRTSSTSRAGSPESRPPA